MTFLSQFIGHKAKVKRNFAKGATLVKSTARNIVARDTGELEENIDTGNVMERTENVISVDIEANTPYAVYVEKGMGKVANYHRDGRVVWSGVGQQFLERAIDINKGQIFSLIQI